MTTRERLLIAGEPVIREHGFSATSFRDVTQAACVPLGSFSNHFGSKHAFVLEIVEHHLLTARALFARTLLNETLPPLHRLESYIDEMLAGLREDRRFRGSLLANLSAEADEVGDATRMRIVETFEEPQRAWERCLHAAVIAGDAPGVTELVNRGMVESPRAQPLCEAAAAPRVPPPRN
jgi:TetR/AcrR family transcriptional repressor of nem operon